MNWIHVINEKELTKLMLASSNSPLLIFKHSTSCGISRMVLKQFERAIDQNPEINYAFVDLLKYRHVSNLVAETTNIRHESPQALFIKDGKVEFHASHYAIIESFLPELMAFSLTS